MRAHKLFHVLVLAGGALALAGCSSAENPAPEREPSTTTDAVEGQDGGTDGEAPKAPAPQPGGGAQFW